MTDVMMTDGIKQHVITRLATINSAISIFNLTNGKSAKISVDEILDLAERIERWAWRDLLGEEVDTLTPEKPVLSKAEGPADPALPASDTPKPPKPHPAPQPREPHPHGDGQHAGEASTKQINAIFAIGRSKGYSSDDLKAWVTGKFGKSVSALSTREASTLIDDLRAL
jgi:hypothetical protein